MQRRIRMIVSILYGRSWQGVSESARLWGNAAFSSKQHVQDFAEESGRDVLCWIKTDKQEIPSRQCEPADYVLVFDPKAPEALMHAKEKAVVIFNSRERTNSPLVKRKSLRAFFVDATGIGLSALLRPSPGPAMLGAFARVFEKMPSKGIKSQIDSKEALAFDEGFKNVKRF